MATRKDICDAFKAAKELTARNADEWSYSEWVGAGQIKRYEFICHALEKLRSMPGALFARAIIHERFKTDMFATTIFAWLLDVAKVPEEQLTDDNVQAYKHRWLDSVIKEFSS